MLIQLLQIPYIVKVTFLLLVYNNTHRINEIGFLEHESDYNKYQLSNSNIYLNVTRLSGGNIGG